MKESEELLLDDAIRTALVLAKQLTIWKIIAAVMCVCCVLSTVIGLVV